MVTPSRHPLQEAVELEIIISPGGIVNMVLTFGGLLFLQCCTLCVITELGTNRSTAISVECATSSVSQRPVIVSHPFLAVSNAWGATAFVCSLPNYFGPAVSCLQQVINRLAVDNIVIPPIPT